jgi:hypothetical protein
VLDEVGETLQSVWGRWAFELWVLPTAKLMSMMAAGGLVAGSSTPPAFSNGVVSFLKLARHPPLFPCPDVFTGHCRNLLPR